MRGGKRLCVLALTAALACASGVGVSPAAAQDNGCAGDVPPNPDGSAFVWSEPQCISPLGNNGEVPQVAIADDGDAVAVWRYQDPRAGGKLRAQVSTRERGENFIPAPSPPEPGDPPDPTFDERLDATFLSDPAHDVGTHIRMDMNKRGDVIVVWEELEDNGSVGVHSAYKPFDGDFGAPQLVERDTAGPFFAKSWVEPEVGIDGEGVATVIYHRPAGAAFNVDPVSEGSSIYQAETRTAGSGGTWGDDQRLVPHDPSSETHPIRYTETHATLDVSESGNRLAVFASQEFDNGTTERQVLEVAQREVGQATWVRRGSNDDTGAADRPITSTHFRLDESALLARGLLTWTEEDAPGHTLFLTEDGPINGPFSGPVDGSGSAVLLDSTIDALGLWSAGGGLRATTSNPLGEPWSAPDADPVEESAGVTRTRPALAAFGDDTAVTTFIEEDGDGEQTVRAALRPAGGGSTFDAPVTLSAAADLEGEGDASGVPFAPRRNVGPKVVATADGEAVATWSALNSEGQFQVHVSVLTPRDDPEIPPPPPPPPPPRPAVVSPIQLARPLARDQAVVLIANVPDDITSLEWNFDSKDEPPIVGTVEGGALQRTVRLRLPGSAFRASVRATGPGGATDYLRTFGALRPSNSSESKEVRRGLAQEAAPNVFAVGKKETLTGGDRPVLAIDGVVGRAEDVRLPEADRAPRGHPRSREGRDPRARQAARSRHGQAGPDGQGDPAHRRLPGAGQGLAQRQVPRDPGLGGQHREHPAGQVADLGQGRAAGWRRQLRPEERLQPQARPQEGEGPARQAAQARPSCRASRASRSSATGTSTSTSRRPRSRRA